MMRRRQMLAASGERSDYIILPKDGEERGIFPVTKITLTKDQTVTVEYAGITDRGTGRMVIDGYFCGANFLSGYAGDKPGVLFYCSKLPANDGTIVMQTTKNGSITIGNSRTAEAGWNSGYACTYIKVRID